MEATDDTKLSVPRFEDKDGQSFHLWKLRVEAVLEMKDCLALVQGEEQVPEDPVELVNFNRKKGKARSIIINALGDRPLKAVQKHSANPLQMWEKLTERYAGQTTSNKLMTLNETFSKILHPGDSIQDHIGDLEVCFTKLANAGQQFNELLQVSILLNSIRDCVEYEPTVAAIRTMDEDKATWDIVTARLIDEYKDRKNNGPHLEDSRLAYMRAGRESASGVSRSTRYRPYKQQQSRKPGRGYNGDHGQHSRIVGSRNERTKNTSSIQENNAKKPKPRLAMARVQDNDTVWDGNTVRFMIDSGATHHMCNDRRFFPTLSGCSVKSVTLGDASKVSAGEVGAVDIELKTSDGKWYWVRLTNVLYVPSLESNLISVACLDSKEISAWFHNGKCKLIDAQSSQEMCEATREDDSLYWVTARVHHSSGPDIGSSVAKSATAVPASGINFTNDKVRELWHKRMGHISDETVDKMLRNNSKYNIDCAAGPDHINCHTCVEQKATKGTHDSKLVQNEDKPGDVLFVDLCGPMPVPTWSNKRYAMVIVDGCTRYSWVFLLRQKSDAYAAFENFICDFKTQHGIAPRRFHSDNGVEFTSKKLRELLTAHGVRHTFTAAYTPQSNGMVERMNRTMMERVRTLLQTAKLEQKFWGEAVHQAIFLINRTPRKQLDYKTPFELFYKKTPDLSKVKTFGCLAYTTVPDQLRRKLDPKARQHIFLGFSKGLYKVFNLESKIVFGCRHVICDENTFPGFGPVDNGEHASTVEFNVDSIDENDRVAQTGEVEPETDVTTVAHEGEQGSSSQRPQLPVHRPFSDTEFEQLTYYPAPAPAPRRSARLQNRAAANTAAANPDVYTFAEAMKSEHAAEFKTAMLKEFTALKERDTWCLSPRSDVKTVLPSKWILQIKRNQDGSVARYKARLVILGNMQPTEDLDSTFAPVIDFTTVRTNLSVAVRRKEHVEHVDVPNAFVNGDLPENEQVGMLQPKLFEDPTYPQYILKILKSIYGLRQAPRVWHKNLRGTFLKLGLTPMQYAESGFYGILDNEHVRVLVYVDDILIMSRSRKAIQAVKNCLKENYGLTELGDISTFLGVNVRRGDGFFTLDQEFYIDKTIKLAGMNDCKPARTPMDPGLYGELTETRTRTDAEDAEMKGVPYCQILGKLLYVSTKTRPDICFAVGILSRHMHAPRPVHWNALKRVLRYLSGTRSYGLVIRPTDMIVRAHADADWAGGTDRKSISGFFVSLGGVPVMWRSGKQTCTALSSTEAEYVSLSTCAREVHWLLKLCAELGIHQTEAVSIFQDNSGSCSWANDSANFGRTKHIDVRLHFVRDLVQNGKIEIKQVPTDKMLADMLTKPLFGPAFVRGISTLSIQDVRTLH